MYETRSKDKERCRMFISSLKEGKLSVEYLLGSTAANIHILKKNIYSWKLERRFRMTPGLGSECGVILYPTSPEWVAMGTSTKISVLETSRRKKKVDPISLEAMVLVSLRGRRLR